jgi:hypothetical protein
VRRLVLTCTLVALVTPAALLAADTPKAAATRKLIKETKIDVDFDDARLEEIFDELKEKAPGFKYIFDSKGGVSRNSKLTYKAKGKTVEEVLNDLCTKGGDLGWFVVSVEKNAYEGLIKVTKGGERGYEKGKEPK